jgi:hypothetical protein
MGASSVVERVKTSLVGLKMRRAVEILDATLRGIERGEITALEAIDALLTEELTIRENRRVKVALRGFAEWETSSPIPSMAPRSSIGSCSLLIRHGIDGFKPRLKNAQTKLCELRSFDSQSLPANTMNSPRLLLAQHRLLSAQLKEIEEARQRVVNVAKPDRLQRMIQTLARVRQCSSTRCSRGPSRTGGRWAPSSGLQARPTTVAVRRPSKGSARTATRESVEC